MFEKFEPGNGKDTSEFISSMGPQQIDHMIRQAIQFCWMALPPNKRNVAEVEKQIRRVVERAIRDMKEDSQEFGDGMSKS